jgi:hypothetical protein
MRGISPILSRELRTSSHIVALLLAMFSSSMCEGMCEATLLCAKLFLHAFTVKQDAMCAWRWFFLLKFVAHDDCGTTRMKPNKPPVTEAFVC